MANKNIRGITIEIGGDTTKLGKALEASEKKSRSLQTELKEIEKVLKFDPTNVEALTQKQNVLTQSIEETTKQLETLKEAEKQVQKQFERGEVAEEQVRALRREIMNTERNLGSMRGELTSTNTALQRLADGTDSAERHTTEYRDSVEKAKKELDDFKGKASSAFDVLKMGAGIIAGATTALGGYALSVSTDFDKAFNTLQTRTGATSDEMVGLNEAMEGVYKNNFGESIEDVAESMALVKTNTKASSDEIQGLTETALLLRDVFDFDVNESTRSAKMLMDQFGISGEQAYSLIAQGAQAGLDKNGDLLDTVNEYAVHYKQLGFTSEEFFNSLVNGASSGTFSVDKLGDAMKEFGIRAKDTATTTDEGFQLIGLDADVMRSKFAKGGESAREATQQALDALFSMDDQVKQNQAGVDLFGTMWEDLGIEGVKALMDVSGEASLTSDALDEINGQKYDDLGSSIGGLKRTLETDIIKPLGDDLKPLIEKLISYISENAPAIRDIVSSIADAVGSFVGFIVDNSEVILATIAGIGTGMLVWNVASIIHGVVGAIKAFKLANEGATIAQWALNMAMNANPIGIIVALIAGLVAAFIVLWNTSDEFREFWINLWEKIKEYVGVAIDFIVELFTGLWDTVSGVVSNIYEFIVNIFTTVRDFISKVINAIVGFFSGMWKKIVTILTPAINWFTKLFSSIYETLKSIIDVIIGLIKGTWKLITTIFGVALSWFTDYVINPVKNAFSKFFEVIKGLASGAWEGIKAIWSAVSGWFNNTIIKPVANFFSGMWEGLKKGASGAWNGIKSVFSSVTSFFSDIFGSAWRKVKDIFSEGGKIFSGIKEGIAETFKKIVNTLIKGINKVVSIPFDAINGMLNKIRNVGVAGVKPFKGLWSKNPISVPQIPELFRGGILKKGQVGLLEGNGAEAVVPLEKETTWINRIAQKMNDLQEINPNSSAVALSAKMDEMIQTMKSLNASIVLDTGVLVGETINRIDDKLSNNYTMRTRRI